MLRHDHAARGFTHGFTYSHHVVGAAAGRAVLAVLRERDLVAAAQERGKQLDAALRAELGDHPAVGDIRGLGLLRGVELVADRETRAPFAALAAGRSSGSSTAGKERGVLLYSSTGCADGVDGDLLVLGPPLVITEAQTDELAALTAAAIRDVLGLSTADGGSGKPPVMRLIDRKVFGVALLATA